MVSLKSETTAFALHVTTFSPGEKYEDGTTSLLLSARTSVRAAVSAGRQSPGTSCGPVVTKGR